MRATLLEVTRKGTIYEDIPVRNAPIHPTQNTQAAWSHLITLSDTVCDGLQLRHGLLVLEIIREGLRPLLQQLHNLGRERLQLGLGQ